MPLSEKEIPEAELRKRYADLLDFVDNAAVGLHWMGPDQTIIWVNQAELNLFGYTRDEYLGMPISHLHADPHVADDILKRLAAGQTLDNYEARVRCKDGTLRTVLITSNVFKVDGKFVHTRCFTRDITDRKKAEQRSRVQHSVSETLLASTDRSQAIPAILKSIGEGLGWDFGAFWKEADSKEILRCDETWTSRPLAFDGISRNTIFASGQGLPGRVWAKREAVWVHDVLNDDNFPRLKKAADEGLHTGIAFPIQSASTFFGVMEFLSKSVQEADTELLRTVSTLGNQIGQFLERAALEESKSDMEARQTAILEAALDCIIAIDESGKIIEFNPAAERTFGFTRESVLGRTLADTIIPPEFRDAHQKGMQRFLDTGEGPILGKRIELIALRGDGSRFPIELAINAIRIHGKPYFTAYLRDITESNNAKDVMSRNQIQLQATENELRQTSAQFQNLADSIPQLAWMANAEGSIAWYNQRWYEYTGTTPDAMKALGWESVHDKTTLPRVLDWWETALKKGEPSTMVFPLRGADGSFRPFLTSVRPVRDAQGKITQWFGTNTDISEQKSAERELERMVAERTAELREKEQELYQSRKLEAVGRLAGGVAHDFNNLLTGIIGCAEELQQGLPPADPHQEEAREILRAGERAAALTKQLLAFGRKQIMRPELLNLNEVLTDTGKLLKRLIGEDVKVRMRLASTLSPIKADRGQLDQIIVNLAVNARDAMPKGGQLMFTTSHFRHVGDDASLDLTPGNYVVLGVTDSGEGMTKDVLGQIFEPFFTTKDRTKGTGLGLATVYGIVKQMRGGIFVQSQPGLGTTFKIFLPELMGGEQSQTPERRASDRDDATIPGGTETILVVEDEELVSRHAARVMRRKGYTVLTAMSGPEALETLKTEGKSVALILSDVIMPGMNGKELVDRVRADYPTIKAIFMSGYPAEVIGQHGVLEPGTVLIEKPFYAAQLLRQIRNSLDRRLPS